jgi:general secretion pathway protein M
MSRAQIVSWYGNLTPRDQRVLRIGGVVMLLILLVGVFLPLQRNINRARAELAAQKADLAWMREVAPTLAAAGPGPVAAATNESLVALIERSARESGLAQGLTGSEPAGEGAMRVRLEQVDFNLLTGWISRLSSQHGVQVVAASVTGSGPGVVNASVQMHTR